MRTMMRIRISPSIIEMSHEHLLRLCGTSSEALAELEARQRRTLERADAVRQLVPRPSDGHHHHLCEEERRADADANVVIGCRLLRLCTCLRSSWDLDMLCKANLLLCAAGDALWWSFSEDRASLLRALLRADAAWSFEDDDAASVMTVVAALAEACSAWDAEAFELKLRGVDAHFAAQVSRVESAARVSERVFLATPASRAGRRLAARIIGVVRERMDLFDDDDDDRSSTEAESAFGEKKDDVTSSRGSNNKVLFSMT